MALPSCPKCSNHLFQATQISVSGARFKYTVVNCTSCGTIVGMMDFYNIGNMLLQMGEKFGIDLS